MSWNDSIPSSNGRCILIRLSLFLLRVCFSGPRVSASNNLSGVRRAVLLNATAFLLVLAISNGSLAQGSGDSGVLRVIKVVDNTGNSSPKTPGQFQLTNEQMNFALTWTHPQRWRVLETIDFRIIDDRGSILWVRFHEPGNTFSLFNPASGRFGNPVSPGSSHTFETNAATMHLADSRVQGSGPDGPSVTLTYSLSFKPHAAQRTYRVEAFATDDFGHQQGFDQVGSLTVMPAAHP